MGPGRLDIEMGSEHLNEVIAKAGVSGGKVDAVRVLEVAFASAGLIGAPHKETDPVIPTVSRNERRRSFRKIHGKSRFAAQLAQIGRTAQ